MAKYIVADGDRASSLRIWGTNPFDYNTGDILLHPSYANNLPMLFPHPQPLRPGTEHSRKTSPSTLSQ